MTRQEVFTFYHEPGRRLVYVTLLLENQPGALAAVTGVLGQLKVNIVSGHFAARSGDRHGTIHLIADVDPKTTVAELEKRVRSVPEVAHVRTIESEGSLLIDPSFPIVNHSGARVLIWTAEPIARALANLREELGSGGSVLVYDAGILFAQAIWPVLQKVVGAATLPSRLGQVLQIYQATGWGRLERTDVDVERKRVSVHIAESFECRGQSGKGPYSQFLRGHLAGMFSVVFSVPLAEVDCREEACLAKGDPACEFTIVQR